MPLAGLTFESDERGDTDQVHLSILVQLRDPTGLVVEKFTEDSPVFLPRQQRAALQQGNAVFLRSFALAPGRYTLEMAVVDQLADRYSVSRSVLDVAAPAPGLAASEIALIKREEAVPGGVLDSPDPFRQGADAPGALAGRAEPGPRGPPVPLPRGLPSEGRPRGGGPPRVRP